MRMADFILANMPAIIAEWERFARSIWPAGVASDPAALRDHVALILEATARDMQSGQSAGEGEEKSRGQGRSGKASDQLDGTSEAHAIERLRSGFDLLAVVSEYR